MACLDLCARRVYVLSHISLQILGSEQMLTIVTEICPLWYTCSVPLIEHVTCCCYYDLDRRQVGSKEVWEGMARPWCRDDHSYAISVKAIRSAFWKENSALTRRLSSRAVVEHAALSAPPASCLADASMLGWTLRRTEYDGERGGSIAF